MKVKIGLIFLMLGFVFIQCKTQTQKDIEKYSSAIYKTYNPYKELLNVFKKWNELGKEKDFDKYKKYLKDDVLLKLNEYNTLVNSIKSDNQELSNIHGIMVKTIKTLNDSFTAFEKDLDKANWSARAADLHKKIKEVKTSEEEYQNQIRAFYTKNGVTKIVTAPQ